MILSACRNELPKRSWWVVSISGDGVVKKKQPGSRLQAVPFSREPAANARYRGVEFSGGGAKPAGCDDCGPPRAGWARAGVHAEGGLAPPGIVPGIVPGIDPASGDCSRN